MNDILVLIGAFSLFSIVALGLLLGCIYLILWGLGFFNE